MKPPLIVLDAADIDAVSRCWAALLGGTVEKDDVNHDWDTVIVDGKPYLAVQLATDHVPPQWPHGSPQQVHFDFHPDDLDAARETAQRAGARLVQGPQEGHTFEVWADPAGHPFCLCWGS